MSLLSLPFAHPWINTIQHLYPLTSALISMVVAQTIKLLAHYYKENKLNFKVLFSSGGMPSGHSALVSGLATSIGLQEGWTSPLFCIAAVVAIVVIHDAAGIRRAAGRQAAVLNQLIEDMVENGKIQYDKVSELLGHTPVEVVIGLLLGVGIATTLFY